MFTRRRTRCMAIDFGDRRIGVAVGDPETGLTRPLEMIDRTLGDAALCRRLRDIVKQEEIGTIVVGDPINMDGSTGPRSEKSQGFAKWLRRAVRQVRVELYDERLSSFEADERMERDGVKASKRREWRDAYAAAVFLEEYFALKRDALSG